MIYAGLIVLAGITIWLILWATEDDQWPTHKSHQHEWEISSTKLQIWKCKGCSASTGRTDWRGKPIE